MDYKHFSSSFYLEKYPDVAKSGQDPIQHYKKYGWREGRDPTPLFSTNYYLQQCKETDFNLLDPLKHYQQVGRHQKLEPHPIFKPILRDAVKIGIVHLDSMNESSLPFDPQILEAHVTFESATERSKSGSDNIFFAQMNKATGVIGVVGAVNRAIAHLNRLGCTHIQLRKSGQHLLGDSFQALINSGHPIVAPALSSAHGPQWAPAPSIILDPQFFKNWRHSFKDRLLFVEHLDLGFLIMRIEAFQANDGFDDRFDSLPMAMIDFCLRLKKLNIIPAVARHAVASSDKDIASENRQWPAKLSLLQPDHMLLAEKHSSFSLDLSHETARALNCDQNNQNYIILPSLNRFKKAIFQKLALDSAQSAQRTTEHLSSMIGWYASQSQQLTHTDPRLLQPYEVNDVEYHSPYNAIKSSKAKRIKNDLIYTIGQMIASNAQDHDPFEQLNRLMPFIHQLAILLENHKPVLFMAGEHDPIRSPFDDGYMQRVLAVDKEQQAHMRLYLNFNATEEVPVNLVQLTKKLWVVNCRVDLTLGRAILTSLLHRIQTVYIHSILAIANKQMATIIEECNARICLDIHGAVPEELIMKGDENLAADYEIIEKIITRRANHIICVSNAMVDHVQKKYPKIQAQFLMLPAVSRHLINTNHIKNKHHETHDIPLMIYAGGAQVWQRIDAMAELFVISKNTSDYLILTPQKTAIKNALLAAGESQACAEERIKSVPPQAVSKWLTLAQYGILLREDTVVNRVSSPTKLIEYLSNDLVPILDFSDIGDFNQLGFVHVPLADAMNKNLPSEPERQLMVQKNKAALKSYSNNIESGWHQLHTLLEQDR